MIGGNGGNASGSGTIAAGNGGQSTTFTSGNGGTATATASVGGDTATGGLGGIMNIIGGNGGVANGGNFATPTGGGANVLNINGGNGGDATSTSATFSPIGGVGGSISQVAGFGGHATGPGGGTGGDGGSVQITAGDGGNADGGVGQTGGNAGSITLAAGIGGSGTGSPGASGLITFQTNGSARMQVSDNGSTGIVQIFGQIITGTWQADIVIPLYGGTGTSTTFNQGSIVFADPSGNYAQATTHFFWDDGNSFLGIGTAAPTSPLQVIGLAVHANNAAAIGAGLTAGAFYRSGADPDQVYVVH
jgi:hypothetical protein